MYNPIYLLRQCPLHYCNRLYCTVQYHSGPVCLSLDAPDYDLTANCDPSGSDIMMHNFILIVVLCLAVIIMMIAIYLLFKIKQGTCRSADVEAGYGTQHNQVDLLHLNALLYVHKGCLSFG